MEAHIGMILKNTQARNKTKQFSSNFSKEKHSMLPSLINTRMAGSGPDTKVKNKCAKPSSFLIKNLGLSWPSILLYAIIFLLIILWHVPQRQSSQGNRKRRLVPLALHLCRDSVLSESISRVFIWKITEANTEIQRMHCLGAGKKPREYKRKPKRFFFHEPQRTGSPFPCAVLKMSYSNS